MGIDCSLRSKLKYGKSYTFGLKLGVGFKVLGRKSPPKTLESASLPLGL